MDYLPGCGVVNVSWHGIGTGCVDRILLDSLQDGQSDSVQRWFGMMMIHYPEIEYVDQVKPVDLKAFDSLQKRTINRVADLLRSTGQWRY